MDIKELLSRAKLRFQELKRLSASCPRCGSQMILKSASNPQRHCGRRLSIILCCSNECDKVLWNTNANEKKFTHWWLDGERNREGYGLIINSLPKEERKLIEKLQKEVIELNSNV